MRKRILVPTGTKRTEGTKCTEGTKRTERTKQTLEDSGNLEARLYALEKEVTRADRRVRVLQRIGRILGSSLALDPLLDEVVRCATELLDADRSTLFLVEGDQLWSKVLEGGGHREIRLPVGRGIAGWVAQTGLPLHTRDPYSDPRFDPDFDRKTGYRTKEILTYPIRKPHRQEGIAGVLQVLNKLDGGFDDDDKSTLEAITSEIGVALEVAGLFEELSQRNRALERTRGDLELLFETERAIGSSVPLEEKLKTILGTALSSLGAASASLRIERGVLSLPRGSSVIDPRSTFDAAAALLIERGEIAQSPPTVSVPIEVDGQEAGRLGLSIPEGTLEPSDRRTLELVSAQVGRTVAAAKEREFKGRRERLSTIGQMLSGVLHDFRTPLTLISGYGQVMARAEEVEDRSRYVELIEKQISLITAMTKELLAFARGETAVFVRKVQTHVFFQDIERYLEAEFDGSGVQPSLSINYRGPARFDESKLRRVVQNIARNAREAMPSGGHFWVTVEATQQDLVLTFDDDGPGIPEAIREHVFEPFTTADKELGTGLGLAMVYQTAVEHEGSVVAERRDGGGTRIQMRLPL